MQAKTKLRRRGEKSRKNRVRRSLLRSLSQCHIRPRRAISCAGLSPPSPSHCHNSKTGAPATASGARYQQTETVACDMEGERGYNVDIMHTSVFPQRSCVLDVTVYRVFRFWLLYIYLLVFFFVIYLVYAVCYCWLFTVRSNDDIDTEVQWVVILAAGSDVLLIACYGQEACAWGVSGLCCCCVFVSFR